MASRIQEIPSHDQPRERLLAKGAAALTDAELLAIFLRTGTKEHSVLDLAAQLIRQWGSLRELARCSAQDLQSSIKGIGLSKAATLCAAFEIGRRLMLRTEARPQLRSPEAIYEIIGQEMTSLRQESLRVVLLDSKLQLIRVEEITRGLINESMFHPREVFRPAIVHLAYAVAVVHNHPSGDPQPSNADRAVTRQLVDAAATLQIKLVDHIIIGNAEGGRKPYYSFREEGLIS